MNMNVSQEGAESGILVCQFYLTGSTPVIPVHLDWTDKQIQQQQQQQTLWRMKQADG